MTKLLVAKFLPHPVTVKIYLYKMLFQTQTLIRTQLVQGHQYQLYKFLALIDLRRQRDIELEPVTLGF